MNKACKLPLKRILVVRYRFIGDTILTVPFLRNLRQAYPEAKIDVLVGPQSGLVLEGCPYIDKLIVYDTTRFHKYDRGQGQARSFWSYVWQLRKEKYDSFFLLKRSLSSALLAFLSGARYRIGYGTEGRNFLLTHPVAWDKNKHEVESTLDVLRAAGVETNNNQLESWITDSERRDILTQVPELASKKTKVLFHAPAAHPDKLYPLQSWALVLKELSAEQEILPFFIGAQEDIKLYDELQELSGIKGICTAGKLSLRQSMALLAELDLAICTDSGPAHLAAAAGTPTLALFGPTDPVRWRPWGAAHKALYAQELTCRPCHYNKTCDNRQCLTELPAALVVKEAQLLLKSRAALQET